MTWTERIPAAIEKAEGFLGEIYGTPIVSNEVNGVMLTAGEVALAKALWKSRCPDSRTDIPNVHDIEVPCPRETALRDFVIKVEAL